MALIFINAFFVFGDRLHRWKGLLPRVCWHQHLEVDYLFSFCPIIDKVKKRESKALIYHECCLAFRFIVSYGLKVVMKVYSPDPLSILRY